jgi:hypothetical protein
MFEAILNATRQAQHGLHLAVFSGLAQEKLSFGKMNPKKLAACALVLALSGRRKPKRRRRVWFSSVCCDTGQI